MKPSDFSQFSARFHRNGISGMPFHACGFLFRRGRKWEPMTAIVFATPGHVAVANPAFPESRWRGDEFEPVLRQLIADNEAPEYYAR